MRFSYIPDDSAVGTRTMADGLCGAVVWRSCASECGQFAREPHQEGTEEHRDVAFATSLRAITGVLWGLPECRRPEVRSAE